MPEDFSPGTIKRINELCRSVNVSPEQDEPIHRELMGHIEDKLRAYMSGGEKITEADALLLVERHFGDIVAIGHQLRSVHSPVRTWLRRLAAIMIVSVLCRLPWMVLFVGDFINVKVDDLRNMNDDIFMAVALSIACSWALLVRWDKTAAAGQAPWFMRWSRRTIVGLTVLSLLPVLAPFLLVARVGLHPSLLQSLNMLMHAADHSFWHHGHERISLTWVLESLSISSAVFGVAPMLGVAEGVLWLWWLNRGTNTLGRCILRITCTLAAWFFFGTVFLGGPDPALPYGPFMIYLLFSWAFWPPIGLPSQSSAPSPVI